MRRKFIFVCLCTLLLTGCDLDIEQAAEDADSAIRNIGYKGQDTQNDLNEIVDNFKEEFGKVGEALEGYSNGG